MTDDITKNILSLPKISFIIREEVIRAKKSLGQNFLIDETIMRQIIRCAKIGPYPVLEVGPGLGSLTREIILQRPISLHLVERDDTFLPYLNVLKGIMPTLTIHNEDAMYFDENTLGQKVQIIANLPYNIGTALLLKWFANINRFHSITVMLQKEVGLRLCAAPGTSHYGRLSILCQMLATAEMVLDVPPASFIPAPKVTSCVVKITPHAKPLYNCKIEILTRITSAAFSQRRKVITKNIRPLFGDNTLAVLEACGINPHARPEELTLAQFAKLSEEYENTSL